MSETPTPKGWSQVNLGDILNEKELKQTAAILNKYKSLDERVERLKELYSNDETSKSLMEKEVHPHFLAYSVAWRAETISGKDRGAGFK